MEKVYSKIKNQVVILTSGLTWEYHFLFCRISNDKNFNWGDLFMKKYKHLTMTKRLQLESYLKIGMHKKEIAQLLGVSLATIYNEIKRGMCEQIDTNLIKYMKYCPDYAHMKYEENLKAKGQDLKIGNDYELAEYIENRIVKGKLSPLAVIGEIKAKCRRLASQENGLAIVIIDYLTLIQGSAKYQGNRQQEVSEISRSLKTMAMDLEVPVIALAQLSRSVEQRDDKRPMLSDLRESGSIEQDADIVAFLYRDDYYMLKKGEEETSDISQSEFIVAKHRSGPTDTINLLFKRNISKFVDIVNKDMENG